jgi:hypothetical protein
MAKFIITIEDTPNSAAGTVHVNVMEQLVTGEAPGGDSDARKLTQFVQTQIAAILAAGRDKLASEARAARCWH